MRAYVFLCDENTEAECLQRKLVGTTQVNAVWAVEIQLNDEVFLYDFHTRELFGPFAVTSTADCHCPGAWQGRFPVQLRFEPTALTRKAVVDASVLPLLPKGRRHSGALDGRSRDSLVGWLAQQGAQL